MNRRAPYVLIVCTANVCRSAMAEALLRRSLDLAGHSDVGVASAGTGHFDLPVDPVACEVVGQRGVDITDHRPRQLTADLLEVTRPDLILTMTRGHLRSVVGLDPLLWPRTFTVRELARRTAALPDDPTSFDQWIVLAGADRLGAKLLADDPDDDIADPYGRGLQATTYAADQIEATVRTIAALGCWDP